MFSSKSDRAYQKARQALSRSTRRRRGARGRLGNSPRSIGEFSFYLSQQAKISGKTRFN